MSTVRRFRGTLLGVVALVVVGGAWVAARRASEVDTLAPEEIQEAIFRFEKEDLVGFDIARPDTTVSMRRVDGEWRVEGADWRPSSAMVRKVAHQLHDLTARATVVDAPEDYALYGLGEGAITVTLHLEDGRKLAFQAGDPNPSAVSWYIRPTPGDRVYVVKKSALDYFRMDLEEFREHKFALFDARRVDALDVAMPDRELAFHRTGEQTWRQTKPIEQAASRDKVRMMLGRVSALRSFAFIEDHPQDLARWGMDPPAARIAVGLDTGERVTIVVGAPIPGTEPPQRYVMRVEDDAVYAVRDGMLESYTLPIGDYRDTILLGKHEWDVASMVVELADEEIAISRTADDWRWPDGQAIPGSTPERVAGRAADVRAVGFHDTSPADAFESDFGSVALTFQDGTKRTVTLGKQWQVEVTAGEEVRTEDRQYATLDGDAVVYEIDGQLADVIEDLHREYGRKREREAERRIDLDGDGG